MPFIVIMILALIFLVALLYPEQNIFKKIASKTPYNICWQSVEASSLMRLKNIELMPHLKCETQQYAITKNDVGEAKETIADAMYNCYYQFFRGEKELFADEGIFCFVCSTIDFEGKGTEIKQIPALRKYLFENYATARNTYAQYLYKYKDFKKIKRQVENLPEYTAPITAQKIGVLFVYRKFKSAQQLEAEQEWKSFTENNSWLMLSPLRLSVKGVIEAGTFVEGKYLGDYTYGGDVVLASPYSAQQINSLGCTQKIQQKTQ